LSSPPVTFDLQTFLGLFPEFTPLSQGFLNAMFMRATGSIIANAVTNPANNDGNLAYLIYLVTAHLAWLNCQKDVNGQPTAQTSAQQASQQVGRISQATQGSVSVTLEWPGNDPSAQEKFLVQTRYGAEYWAATAQYRTAQYAARPTFVIGGRFRNPLWRSTTGLWGFWG
jgi:hypothetical protein